MLCFAGKFANFAGDVAVLPGDGRSQTAGTGMGEERHVITFGKVQYVAGRQFQFAELDKMVSAAGCSQLSQGFPVKHA